MPKKQQGAIEIVAILRIVNKDLVQYKKANDKRSLRGHT